MKRSPKQRPSSSPQAPLWEATHPAAALRSAVLTCGSMNRFRVRPAEPRDCQDILRLIKVRGTGEPTARSPHCRPSSSCGQDNWVKPERAQNQPRALRPAASKPRPASRQSHRSQQGSGASPCSHFSLRRIAAEPHSKEPLLLHVPPPRRLGTPSSLGSG